VPVQAKALGAELTPVVTEVTPRLALAFAAGIGDLGPRTFDDDGPAPLVAPPSFCARLEWSVLRGGRAAALRIDEQEARRSVHVGQDSTFHRPLRPGDRLRTEARVVGMRATRAGTLVEIRFVTGDEATGEAAVTTWYACLYRGVALEGDGGRLLAPPEWPEAPVGSPSRVPLPISREAAHVYSECAGIWNPIHTERRAARAAGLPELILHGSATWAFAGREILRAHASFDPTRLRRLRARFHAPVLLGTTVWLSHLASAGGEHVHFTVVREDGQVAIEDGYASLGPPPEGGRG